MEELIYLALASLLAGLTWGLIRLAVALQGSRP
jgi:hypothetical protein